MFVILQTGEGRLDNMRARAQAERLRSGLI